MCTFTVFTQLSCNTVFANVHFAGPTLVQQQAVVGGELLGQAAGQQAGYLQLLQQREEENRQEVDRLTAEIKALKLQLLQLTGE